MRCHELREGAAVAGPCSRQELHRHASILASPVLTVAICPSTLKTPASLETGRWQPPGFPSSWCQPFRDGLPLKRESEWLRRRRAGTVRGAPNEPATRTNE